MSYILYCYLLWYIEIMDGDIENAYIVWKDHIQEVINLLDSN